MEAEEKITRLDAFKDLVTQWWQSPSPELRSRINQNQRWVRQEVIEAGCFKTLTISPPPMFGGLVMQNVDPFAMMFNSPWDMDLMSVVVDMIDETIGVLRSMPVGKPPSTARITSEIVENYAFVAMPMDRGDAALEDVLDAIKEAAHRCGIKAERVDDPESSDRITDRILESIGRAEFVIADLTNSKPNVYYEAGYAHALGKTPIYIAKEGTDLEFDLKDYPVIFFRNLAGLKQGLEKRLRALAAERTTR